MALMAQAGADIDGDAEAGGPFHLMSLQARVSGSGSVTMQSRWDSFCGDQADLCSPWSLESSLLLCLLFIHTSTGNLLHVLHLIQRIKLLVLPPLKLSPLLVALLEKKGCSELATSFDG